MDDAMVQVYANLSAQKIVLEGVAGLLLKLITKRDAAAWIAEVRAHARSVHAPAGATADADATARILAQIPDIVDEIVTRVGRSRDV